MFGEDGKLDENDDDDDDDDAEPVRKSPVRPAPLTRRASSRVKGVAAPEPADDMVGTKKGKQPPDGRESADAGAARASGADVLADEASEASSAGSEVDEADAQDESVAAVIVLLAAGAAAVDEKDKINQHKSGVWGTKSPTGYVLTSERVAKMGHKDGKPWEVEVWNMIENPGGGNDVANALSFPRLYEHKSRAILTVPFLGNAEGWRPARPRTSRTHLPDRLQPTRGRVQRHAPVLRRPRLLR